MLDNHLQLNNLYLLNQFLKHVEEVYHFDEEFEDFFHTKYRIFFIRNISFLFIPLVQQLEKFHNIAMHLLVQIYQLLV